MKKSTLRLSFKNFFKGEYPEVGTNGEAFQLYIVRHRRSVKYIGISQQNIYNRWFSFSRSHIIVNIYGELLGNSTIGKYVAEHKNEIYFELWTCSDCKQYCIEHKIPMSLKRYEIKDYEPILINKMKPGLNQTYNN
jgi:hypothetical protein